jgi:hypothetical protein
MSKPERLLITAWIVEPTEGQEGNRPEKAGYFRARKSGPLGGHRALTRQRLGSRHRRTREDELAVMAPSFHCESLSPGISLQVPGAFVQRILTFFGKVGNYGKVYPDRDPR